MSQQSKVQRAIARAERVLPGRETKRGVCPRWQAIIAVGEFIESDPIPVSEFALKWARRRGRDLGTAIHCCLIEHLLEHHFELVFPRMRKAARESARVADLFIDLWKSPFVFGQATQPDNLKRLRRLSSELRRIHSQHRTAT
jgi:hypothetical protein